jgi:hypothetical protein
MAKTPSPQPVDDDEVVAAPTKGHATPTRKQQEAARKRPLVPSDRREASRQSKTQMQAARERARVGMANGEEKFLPVRDKGPQKRYIRDYIDARFSMGEILLPLLVLVIVGTFIEPIAPYLIIAVWGVLLILLIEGIIVSTLLRRKLKAKFGEGKVERGIALYAIMRMTQMRIMRLPKPQVKRGEFPS